MKYLFITLAITFQLLNVAIASTNKQTINIAVTEKGFEPATLKVAPNQEISLAFTRKTDSTCATEIIFPAQKIKKDTAQGEKQEEIVAKAEVKAEVAEAN